MSDMICVATRKGLFLIERGAGGAEGRWRIVRTAFLGDNVVLAMHDPRDGALYAALSLGHFGGKMHRSMDRGATWEEIGVPEYPEPPGGQSPDLCPMRGTAIPWQLELIWALSPGGRDQPGLLWCGTIPGGLFRSDDRGATWSINEPLWNEPARKQWFGGGYDHPGIHSIIVDPRNPRRIIAGVSCGGVWETLNGGGSWACRADGMSAAYMPPEQANNPAIQDPHIVVASKNHPDSLWAQHHNGIFRSTDGCKSWYEIKEPAVSGFGFACAVHPDNGDTAWFVPAIKDEKRIPVDGKLVVTRTRDGGRSFDVLGEGLPQEHAYDIAYRHALDIDRAGQRLSFGTTTGSLFVSENQGDAWRCVSQHLPPVHCVRFI
ncbi:MAG TPA: exo-alpha-sialidase [Phycisphaerae bacterium]|nr:exo-alpha-sialidase [Phycisphaerae bacterium]